MCGLMAWSWQTARSRGELGEAVLLERPAVPEELGWSESRAVSRGSVASVHAASAVELADGSLRAYWFGGSREGADDVSIWTARRAPGSESWGQPTIAVDRLWLEKASGQNIRKLGNPVAHRSPDGEVELFVVGVSLGGWSGSSIYHLRSGDEGLSFSKPRRLITSPLANLSTLVKGAAFDTEDGGLLLPVYHELATVYPQLLRLDAKRKVVGLRSWREARGLLQPWAVPGEDGLEMLLRDMSDVGRVHTLSSAGVEPLDIPNPNSAVAAIALQGGTLLACNDTGKEDSRSRMALYFRPAGGTEWRLLRHLALPEAEEREDEGSRERISYPWLMQSSDGTLHLFFTWHRREIRHLQFDAREWDFPE